MALALRSPLAAGVALALGCSAASAQNSTLRFLVSINGGSFEPTQLALPGDVATVIIQAVAPAGAAVDGFAGVSFLPQLISSLGTPISPVQIGAWSPSMGSDARGGPGVDRADGLGRPQPFGLPGTQVNPTISPLPNGLAFGGLGANDSLSIAQFPRTLATNAFGSYFDPSSSPIIFRFRFTIPATQSALDTYTFDVPPAAIQSQMLWYDPANPTRGLAFPPTRETISPGQVILIPAPAGSALLVLGGLLAARPRRERTRRLLRGDAPRACRARELLDAGTLRRQRFHER